MSITINAKGTSIPFFKIGKAGVTLYQGSTDPILNHTVVNGDCWINTSSNSMLMWSSTGSEWKTPNIGNIEFSSSTITAAATTDLTLKVTSGNEFVLDAGPGDAVLTTLTGKDLYISDAIGGDLYLNVNKWPSGDGTANQVLFTDGSGILSWGTLPTIAASALTGTTLASNVVSSSLTSVGTLTSLTVSGIIDAAAIKTPVSTKTANYTITSSDSIILVDGTCTITLPSAVTIGHGMQYIVKRIGSGTVTIDSVAGDIDGETTIQLTTLYSSLTLVSDGANWWVI